MEGETIPTKSVPLPIEEEEVEEEETEEAREEEERSTIAVARMVYESP